jgi:hypothetical protein
MRPTRRSLTAQSGMWPSSLGPNLRALKGCIEPSTALYREKLILWQFPLNPIEENKRMSIIRMRLGALDGVGAAPAPSVQGRISSHDRFFADFQSYLVALHGFALVAEAAKSGSASLYGAGDAVSLSCKLTPEHWLWVPAPTVALLGRNISPSTAHLERMPCSLPSANAVLNLGALAALLHNFGQGLATNFFERNLPTLKATYGTTPVSWPDPWDFGRVVRNAMSHGGKINISNATAAPVRWKGLCFSHADNGRQILHTDLWPGDLFNLILEMDAAL